MKIVTLSNAQGSLGRNDGCEKAPEAILECLKEDIWANEDGKRLTYDVVDSTILPSDSFVDIEKKTASLDGDIFLGGDHSLTYSLFKHFVKKHPRAGLIIFDAHPESFAQFKFPTHGDWLRYLLDEGILDPAHVLLVGVRSFEPSEIAYLRGKGVRIFMMKQLFEDLSGVCDTVMELARSFDPLYLSIDIDVLDPSCAPGTGYAEPGGLTTRQLLYLLQRLKLLRNLRRIDLVEVNPDKDSNRLTVKAAAKILAELL